MQEPQRAPIEPQQTPIEPQQTSREPQQTPHFLNLESSHTVVLPFTNFRTTNRRKFFNEISIEEIINRMICAWRMGLSSSENYHTLDNMIRDIKYKIKMAFIDNIPSSLDDEKIMSIILNNSEQLSKKFILQAKSIKEFNNNNNNDMIQKIIQPYIKKI